MSWTRSMSEVSRTPSACSKSSSARTATVAAAASANGMLACSPGMSRALAMVPIQLPAGSRRTSCEVGEHDALAQAAAGDLEREAPERLRGGAQQHEPGRQQPHALAGEREARRRLAHGMRRDD